MFKIQGSQSRQIKILRIKLSKKNDKIQFDSPISSGANLAFISIIIYG